MKTLKLFLAAAAIGTCILNINEASAFPLTLTKISGTVTRTGQYGIDAANTPTPAAKVVIGMPRILSMLSNEVFLDTGTNPPADFRIVIEPVTRGLYLTNDAGFRYNLESNGQGDFNIEEIATTFTISGSAISESDTVLIELQLRGQDPSSGLLEIQIRGTGSLKYKRDAAGAGTMTLSVKGSGYGGYSDSASGVFLGNFTAQGAGAPEWTGPFSVFWWND